MGKLFLYSSVFICACFAGLWLNSFASAASPPVADQAFDAAAKGLDKAKSEVQKLKDSWDKARMETTLYDQRAKRAYEKWAKAKKDLKKKAEEQKERAQLELQLSLEKRKLAWSEWQAAQYRLGAHELEMKLLDQEKNSQIVRERIEKMESKLKAPVEAKTPPVR